jgi:hypothetical protein
MHQFDQQEYVDRLSNSRQSDLKTCVTVAVVADAQLRSVPVADDHLTIGPSIDIAAMVAKHMANVAHRIDRNRICNKIRYEQLSKPR